VLVNCIRHWKRLNIEEEEEEEEEEKEKEGLVSLFSLCVRVFFFFLWRNDILLDF